MRRPVCACAEHYVNIGAKRALDSGQGIICPQKVEIIKKHHYLVQSVAKINNIQVTNWSKLQIGNNLFPKLLNTTTMQMDNKIIRSAKLVKLLQHWLNDLC